MNTTRAMAISVALLLLVFGGIARAGAPILVPQDHATIQAAIDAASPGDKILVDPGIYNENLVVDVHNVRIAAREGLHSVILDGTGISDVDGILVTANHVVLEGLTVRNFRDFVGPGAVAFRVGILVEGNHCRLNDNLAHSNGDGIVLRGASHCLVKHNTARNNIHNGFFVRNGSWRNILKDNVGLDNGPDMNPTLTDLQVPAGVGCGIQLSFDPVDNEVKNNGVSGNGRGIQLDRGATDNSVKNNTSTNNSRFGIAALAVGGALAASGNAIKNNTALANGEFDLIDQNFPPAVGNTWKGNAFETSNF